MAFLLASYLPHIVLLVVGSVRKYSKKFTSLDLNFKNEFLTKNNYQVLKDKLNFTYSTILRLPVPLHWFSRRSITKL